MIFHQSQDRQGYYVYSPILGTAKKAFQVYMSCPLPLLGPLPYLLLI